MLRVGPCLEHRICLKRCVTFAQAKECVNEAFELPLGEGLRFEKRMFWR